MALPHLHTRLKSIRVENKDKVRDGCKKVQITGIVISLTYPDTGIATLWCCPTPIRHWSQDIRTHCERNKCRIVHYQVILGWPNRSNERHAECHGICAAGYHEHINHNMILLTCINKPECHAGTRHWLIACWKHDDYDAKYFYWSAFFVAEMAKLHISATGNPLLHHKRVHAEIFRISRPSYKLLRVQQTIWMLRHISLDNIRVPVTEWWLWVKMCHWAVFAPMREWQVARTHRWTLPQPGYR